MHSGYLLFTLCPHKAPSGHYIEEPHEGQIVTDDDLPQFFFPATLHLT